MSSKDLVSRAVIAAREDEEASFPTVQITEWRLQENRVVFWSAHSVLQVGPERGGEFALGENYYGKNVFPCGGCLVNAVSFFFPFFFPFCFSFFFLSLQLF
jgi:hypothetical protein